MNRYVKLDTVNTKFEEAKELAFGGIGANYALLGELEEVSYQYLLYNLTDVNIWISLDGVTDHILLPSGATFVSDVGANGGDFRQGTTLYAKRHGGVNPTSGSVVVCSSYRHFR